MRKSSTSFIFQRFLFILLFLSGNIVKSQNLPAEFHFSADGLKLIRGGETLKGLYDETTLDTISLQFSQSNYWTLLTNNYQSKTDLPATLIYKGDKYDSVGVRFKGMTSYMMVNNSKKKSFNITMDYIHSDQKLLGYKTLNLNNAAEDPSMMREVLYNSFSRKHIPGAKSNFVILEINGENWGVYTNVQQLDKQHAREWFIDDEATRWRAESETTSEGGGMPGGGTLPGGDSQTITRPGGGGFPGGGGIPGGGIPGDGNTGGGNFSGGNMFGAGTSSLNYLGTDTSKYTPNYNLKNAYKSDPWEDLVRVCNVLNNTSKANLVDSLSHCMDIDGTLWFLATEILFTDDDSYVNKGGMDYYVYFDVATNRLVPVEYDGNTTFTIKNQSSWGPFYNVTNAKLPLLNILLTVPELRQRYLAHVRTILTESFDAKIFDAKIDNFSNLIKDVIKNDTKKLYTISQFTSEIDKLKTFITTRGKYISSNTEVNKKGLSISSLVYKVDGIENAQPDSTQSVVVTASITGDIGIDKVKLYYGTGFMGQFVNTEMYDDGKNQDKTAGDGIYTATIPPQKKGTYVRFYIESVAGDAAGTRTYEPAGAEFDVYIYQVKYAEIQKGSVVINELMTSNSKSVADQDGEYDDWIELYNNSDKSINLSGYFLTNKKSNLTKWQFPYGTTIEGNGYLVIWADNDTLQTGLHTNFKLAASGENLMLITPDITIADQVLCSLGPDIAYARSPNGTGQFVRQTPTFNQNNYIKPVEVITTGVSNEITNKIAIYPNPAKAYVYIQLLHLNTDNEIFIYNSSGNVVYRNNIQKNNKINVSNWQSGLYVLKSGNLTKKFIVIR